MASTFVSSHTLIYIIGTLGIRHVRYKYVCEVCGIHTDRLMFWTCSEFFSVCERIECTLLIRLPYVRQTLDTLDIRLIR